MQRQRNMKINNFHLTSGLQVVEASWVYLGSERKQRALSNKLVGDNLEVELAPFSFQLSNGGEELRGAASAYTPSLTRKVVQLLEQNEM